MPPGLLPPGFVAIDLAHRLRMSLFDPDATGDAKYIAVPDGSFPARGNGLIGDSAAQPEVVVVANGGSDLIYVTSPDKLMAERIVQLLSSPGLHQWHLRQYALRLDRRHAAAIGGGAGRFRGNPNTLHCRKLPKFFRWLR